MPLVSKLQLPFEQWPKIDRRRWEHAFHEGDIFDDSRRGAHLAEATRKALKVSYAQYLRFLSQNHAHLLTKPLETRIDRRLIAEYVGILRKTNQDISIATSLHHLRLALRLICPKVDWSWLLTITKRIAASARRRPKKYAQVSSDRLYVLGLELMDQAVAETSDQEEITKASAIKYRDGLLIAMLSLVVPRRRTITAWQTGKHLVRAGDLWALEIPPEDVKGKRPLDYALPPNLCERIDLHLRKFRPRLPGSDGHTGLWPSNKNQPMSAGAIYDTVCSRTKKAFGFSVNPHRFRHAAGTLWSIEDPKNVRGVKDLYGHISFESTTEVHYLIGQSRLAGRALARAIEAATNRP
jgi:integrase